MKISVFQITYIAGVTIVNFIFIFLPAYIYLVCINDYNIITYIHIWCKFRSMLTS